MPITQEDPCYADVAILTALPEEVLAAIMILDGGDFSIIELDGSTYLHGVVTPRGNRSKYSVVIALLSSYGGLDAAAEARSLTEIWRPQVLFVLGIAAGIPHRVKLGDVVLGNAIFEDVYGKFDRETFISKGRRLRVSPELVAKCKRIQPSRWPRRILGREPVGPRGTPSQLRTGLVISTTAVYGSDKKRKELLSLFPDALAIEMEACGAIRGSIRNRHEPANCLIVKGISDYGGDKKADDPWRDIAARAAAAHVRAFLVDGTIQHCSHSATYPSGSHVGSAAEKNSWLGDLHFQQGKHREAEPFYEAAWEAALEARHLRPELLASIALNLGHIRRLRGSIVEAHHIAKIASVLSRELSKDLNADSDYLMGLIAREYGEMKLAIRYFKSAEATYAAQANPRGQANAMRGLGYSYYSLGDYQMSYRILLKSHKLLTRHERPYDRLPEAAESFDMLGRALRQLCSSNRDRAKYRQLLGRRGLRRLPTSSGACLRLALHYYEDGQKIANASGDLYRLAESYLSYVILHCEFPSLRYYRGHVIDPWDALRSNFRTGSELAERNDYSLLLCLFEKYMGNGCLDKGLYRSAFRHYAKRYLYAQNVRAIERHSALEEMATKLISLPNDKARECLRYFTTSLRLLRIDDQDPAYQFCRGLRRALK